MSEVLKLPKVRGTYRHNFDLSKSNWFRVGGKAQVLFLPKDAADLQFFLQNKPQDLPINILGACSNVIIADGMIEGVTIKLGGGFGQMTHQNGLLKIGAGALCQNAALFGKINSLTNLEFLSTIPGSIGGAIAMNAGCYGGEMSQILVRANALDFDGNLIELQNADFGFEYRRHNLQQELIFVEALLKVEKGDAKKIGAMMADFAKKRADTQPLKVQTGGSTFKNPKNSSKEASKKASKKAWQLIDEAGCRGLKMNNAMMSEKHCNFMVNLGGASSADLIALGDEVIDRVKEKTGVKLEWEIKRVGN
jgi:UDP-N-acetylmuramate dehydrogenase